MRKITTPDDPALEELCERLAERSGEYDMAGAWPAESLDLCGKYGVWEWFLPREWGGQQWSGQDVVRGYLRLAAACLTTTFIITQRTGACRRIAVGQRQSVKRRLLPDLVSGASFATVGVSHLTTSRRHLAKPAMRAETRRSGFVLDGFSPWVTGAAHAETVVVGATLDDGREILVALPMERTGVEAGESAKLVGLSGSHTGPVHCRDVFIEEELVVSGPVEKVMQTGSGASTGGLQTSTLAAGLADAAIRWVEDEASRRDELRAAAEGLRRDESGLRQSLLALAEGDEVCTLEELRTRANSLAIRAAQAALTAAKGAGYVEGHPAGRWCRESLFFLVWSCPQPVLAANLCELAGIT